MLGFELKEITLLELKEGDVGVITHCVNQPSYIGNRIESHMGKIIMSNKLGFSTEVFDMRFPHHYKIKLDIK